MIDYGATSLLVQRALTISEAKVSETDYTNLALA